TLHPATAKPAPSNPELPVPEVTALKAASPNGSPSLSPSRLPQARRLSSKLRIVVGAVLLALLAGGGSLIYILVKGAGSKAGDVLTHVVRMENLQMAITERGQLESASNR